MNKILVAVIFLSLLYFEAFSQNWGKTPNIGSDGVMEIGKFLDFHEANTGTGDFSARIWAEGNILNTYKGFRIFGNSSTSTNLILAANYPNSFRWKFRTTDRGSGVDLDILSSNATDQEETMFKLSPSYTGRPELAILNDAFVLNNGNIGIGTIDPTSKLAIVSNTNGWMITSKATVTTAGETNGIKLLTGYPNDTNKWAAIAAIAEDLHSNNTGLALYSSAAERIRIAGNGNVGIGTSTPKAKLAVEGNIVAREIKVVTNIEAPDYVFEPDYKMLPLTEVEKYVKENRHLPEIPSAKQIKRDGLDLAEMNLLLLKKVEELTLHQIDLLKELQQLKSELSNHLNENHNK